MGAFVVYPGSRVASYVETDGEPLWKGIGAIPLDPKAPGESLRTMLVSFLGFDAAT